MSYFFTPHMPEDGILRGAIVDHLISTRIQTDQIFDITNLQGSRWQVKLIYIDKKNRAAQVSLIQFEYIKRSIAYPRVNNTLIQSQVDKSYLEKMFEILPFSLFDKVVLFHSQYSLKQEINLERLDKILIRSLEQSQQIYKPEIILSQDSINRLIQDYTSGGEINFILDTQKQSPKIQNNPKHNFNNSVVWIGPEGGWSKAELELFNNQFQHINLGTVIYPAWLCSLAVR